MKTPSERVEKLLVVLLLNSMKGETIKYKAIQLNLAGFSNLEIAELLDTSPQVIANYVYQTRKSKK